MPKKKKIVIVGGGPIGCVAALFMARHGYEADIYEQEADPRTPSDRVKGKSINLTLSDRGLSALKKIGLKEIVCAEAIECYGRVIHDRDGKTRKSLYGEKGEAILSISRDALRRKLIDAVDECPKTNIRFEHKFETMVLETGELKFRTGKGAETISINPDDVILGCDGANSRIRKYMSIKSNLGYREESIEERYLELNMPATEDNQFAMEENYLHIWARDDFMMVGLPNYDRSFTVIMFMPAHVFDSLKDRKAARDFALKHFSDAATLIGQDKIVDQLTSQNSSHPLMWVKCSPFHMGGKILLLGDAAHAMVPFYGQGVNCGFEDIKVLDELLNRHNENFEIAMKEFSEKRTVDSAAICDLSLENYKELKQKVNNRWLSCRKKIDSFLYKIFPRIWIPVYTMVVFSSMRYSDCVKSREWQDKILFRCLFVGGAVAVAVISWLCSMAYTQLH